MSIDRVRRLAGNYWTPVITVGAGGASAVLLVYKVLFASKGIEPETWATIASIVGFAVLVRFPGIATRITKLLLPPSDATLQAHIFHGSRSYEESEADQFFGRAPDLKECKRLLGSTRLLILEGESGCGKSSFLRAGIIPAVRAEFEVVRCRISGEPVQDVSNAVERTLAVPAEAEPVRQDVIAALGALRQNAQKPVLLCLDQFDELFSLAPENVRRDFFVLLEQIVAARDVQVLICIREDYTDLLGRALRQQDPDRKRLDPTYFTLEAFTVEQAKGVLADMLKAAGLNDPVKEQEFAEFSAALVTRLARPPRDPRRKTDQIPTVLPVDLQIAGRMAEELGGGTPSKRLLNDQGGLAGLYRAFLENLLNEVRKHVPISAENCVAILKMLVTPDGDRVARTVREISQALSLSPKDVADTLDRLALMAHVRRLPLPENAGRDDASFELMHVHLARILNEAPEKNLQRQREREFRLDFWVKRSETVKQRMEAGGSPVVVLFNRIFGWFTQPIPMLEIVQLRRYARTGEQRDALRRSTTSFFVRNVVVLIALAGAVVLFVLWQRTESVQVRLASAEISDADVLGRDIDRTGAAAWVGALLHNGEVERALTLLKGMDSAPSMANAARTLAAMGELDEAFRFLGESLKEAPSWDDAHGGAVDEIVKQLRNEGDVDRLIGWITDSHSKYPRFTARVAMQAAKTIGAADVGSVRDRLLATATEASGADDITDARERFGVLEDLISLHKQFASLPRMPVLKERALQTARAEGEDAKAVLLARYAAVLATLDDWQGSRSALIESLEATRSSSANGFDDAIRAVAEAWATAGRAAALFDIVRQCKGTDCEDSIETIALGFLRAGDTASAFSVLGNEKSASTSRSVRYWWDIAFLFIGEPSCKVLKEIWPRTSYATPEGAAATLAADQGVVATLVRCHEIEKALQVALPSVRSATVDARFQLNGLTAIAKVAGADTVRAAAGKLPIAERCVLESRLLEQQITVPDEFLEECAVSFNPLVFLSLDRYQLLTPAVAKLCLTRPAPKATECLNKVTPFAKQGVLTEMATSYVKRGQPDEALALVKLISEPKGASSVNASIQIALAAADKEDVLARLPAPTMETDRATVSCALALMHARNGKTALAREYSRTCNSAKGRLSAHAQMLETYAISRNPRIKPPEKGQGDNSLAFSGG